MPHFRKGYDERLDLTEDEWLEQQMYDSMGEDDYVPSWAQIEAEFVGDEIEGEPFEDTFLPGIPDYDIFNRPSWEVED